MFFHKFDKTMREVREDLQQQKDIILVDVRFEDEYKEGHIPGAILLPLPQLEEMAVSSVPKDKVLYVYCRSGQRSSNAVKKLKALGYTNVFNIGGIIHWSYEIEK